jgi:hypothetical protein
MRLLRLDRKQPMAITIRKEMPDVQLTKEEFKKR